MASGQNSFLNIATVNSLLIQPPLGSLIRGLASTLETENNCGCSHFQAYNLAGNYIAGLAVLLQFVTSLQRFTSIAHAQELSTHVLYWKSHPTLYVCMYVCMYVWEGVGIRQGEGSYRNKSGVGAQFPCATH